MASRGGFLDSITGIFGPSEPKEVADRRFREQKMQASQLQIAKLRQGIEQFKLEANDELKQFKKNHRKGHVRDAQIHWVNYQTCLKEIDKLQKTMMSISGIKYSMKSAEYSLGASKFMAECQDYFSSVGSTIDPALVDHQISVIQDQEIIVDEIAVTLSHPFSRTALDIHEQDETMIQQMNQFIEASEGGSRPKEGPDDLAIMDLPSIPNELRETKKAVPKKRKKRRNLAAKPLF